MKVPTYRKYGLSKKKFDKIKLRNSKITFLLTHEIPLAIGVVIGIGFWILSYNKLNPSGILEILGQIFLFGTMGVICVGIPMLIFKGIENLYYTYLSKSSDDYKGTLMYEADREKFNYWKIRRDESYWKLLDGLSFEYEVLNVFSQIGYILKSEITDENGSRGFLLEYNNYKYLLLCKTGKVNSNLDDLMKFSEEQINAYKNIIIVTPGSFTPEFINEARNKSVKLVSVKELAEIVRTIKE